MPSPEGDSRLYSRRRNSSTILLPANGEANPPQTTLGRYEEIFGHQNPITTEETTRLMQGITGITSRSLEARYNRLFHFRKGFLSPDFVMYLYDSYKQREMLRSRYNPQNRPQSRWEFISMKQAAFVLSAISPQLVSPAEVYSEIRRDVVKAYPVTKKIFRGKMAFMKDSEIPAEYFLSRFDKLFPRNKKREAIDQAIGNSTLSPVEYAVLVFAIRLKDVNEIAKITGLSKGTIQYHKHVIFKKLNIDDPVHALITAINVFSQGLLPAEIFHTLTNDLVDLVKDLTTREHEVLSFVSQGLLNKEIAAKLGISQAIVRAHVHSILRKCRAKNRKDLVVLSLALRSDSHAINESHSDTPKGGIIFEG